jgi:arsenite methyltransferase
LERILQTSGFTDIRITVKENSREFIKNWYPGMNLQNYVVSAYIEARKP